MNLLHRDMQQYNISLITANSFSSSVKEPIQDLQVNTDHGSLTGDLLLTWVIFNSSMD